MEANSTEHIGTAELAKMLEESRGRPQPASDATIHPHLATCTECRHKFEGLSALERQAASVKEPDSALSRSHCPAPNVWRDIAGGRTSPEATLKNIEHASRCGHCGPLLRRAVGELAGLNGELTDAEREYIANLDSARAVWQQSLAKRIVGSPQSRPDSAGGRWWLPYLSRPRYAIAAAFLVVIVAGYWFATHRNENEIVNQLIARAYIEKRTLELRIGTAGYAPVRLSRGPASSFTNRPTTLLKAETLIAVQLESHPTDPAWLQAKAQADVLEGKYDAAIDSLRHALQLAPGSSSILTDLATATFQRGLEGDRPRDIGAAYENLSQALKLRPDDSVALFNRAIVSEHEFLYQQALGDWDHYLRVDSTSSWAEEARKRKDALLQKLREHGAKATSLLSPAKLIAIASDASRDSVVDSRLDEYLHEAIISWLPQAFLVTEADNTESGKTKATADKSALQALFFLAKLTARQHNDQWLVDLLGGSSAPRFPQAIAALSRSVKANDAAEYIVSVQQAHVAEELFRSTGNVAGVLRARFEKVFAEQVERHSQECSQEAAAALMGTSRHSYPWLQIQFGLEKSVCSGLMNDQDTFEISSVRALEQARQSSYTGLGLRAALFVADTRIDAGHENGGFKLLASGLQTFWAGAYPIMRGYGFYAELAYNAELDNQSSLRAALWSEAVALIDSDQDLLLRASAHNLLADADAAAQMSQLAQAQYVEAARLFSAAPQTEATRIDGLEMEIRTSQLEARDGRFEDAIKRLARVQDQIPSLSNNYTAQMFYSTLGEFQLSTNHAPEAEKTLRSALALSELSLSTLASQAERTSWSKSSAPTYLAMVEAQLKQGRSQDALQTYECYLAAPGRSSSADDGCDIGDASRLRQVHSVSAYPWSLTSRLPLIRKETVLAYAALPHGLAIWVYDDRGIQTHWIPKVLDGDQELAERFHELVADPKSEITAVRRDARSLYEILIAPAENDLALRRPIVIEADGWLAGVPFEALLDSHDRYFLERNPITHSVAPNFRPNSDNEILSTSRALIVGSTASSPEDGMIPLSDTTAEADAVAGHFRSAQALTGANATLNAVRAILPEAEVFHFAGHSLATPDKVGLLLENDNGKSGFQLLDAAVIAQVKVPKLQLAVLSACNTGESGGSSRAFSSITESLLRAGVPHVVASRWAVDSAISRQFVADFYAGLFSGESVSESTQETSRRISSNALTSHPYYWSAFAAYGER